MLNEEDLSSEESDACLDSDDSARKADLQKEQRRAEQIEQINRDYEMFLENEKKNNDFNYHNSNTDISKQFDYYRKNTKNMIGSYL